MSSDCNAYLNFCDESFSQKNCFGRGVKESFIIVSFDESLGTLSNYDDDDDDEDNFKKQ